MLGLRNHIAQLQHQKTNHLQDGGNYQQLHRGNTEPFIHIRQIKQIFLLLSWVQEMGKNIFEQNGKKKVHCVKTYPLSSSSPSWIVVVFRLCFCFVGIQTFPFFSFSKNVLVQHLVAKIVVKRSSLQSWSVMMQS